MLEGVHNCLLFSIRIATSPDHFKFEMGRCNRKYQANSVFSHTFPLWKIPPDSCFLCNFYIKIKLKATSVVIFCLINPGFLFFSLHNNVIFLIFYQTCYSCRLSSFIILLVQMVNKKKKTLTVGSNNRVDIYISFANKSMSM